MSLSFAQGNIATTTTPGEALYNVVATHLAACGWTLEDTVVNPASGPTFTYKVWKNPAANHGHAAALPFYVVFAFTTAGANNLTIYLVEEYNAAADTFTKPAPAINSNKTPHATGYYVQDAASALGTTANRYAVSVGTSFNGFNYVVSVTHERVVVATDYASINQACYAGVYESFLSLADDPFPLIVIELSDGSSGASATGSTTREPKQTAASTSNFGAYIDGSGLNWTPDNANSIDIYTGYRSATRIIIKSGRGSGYRGLLKDVIMYGGTARNGDRLTITNTGGTYTYARTGGIIGASSGDYWARRT